MLSCMHDPVACDEDCHSGQDSASVVYDLQSATDLRTSDHVNQGRSKGTLLMLRPVTGKTGGKLKKTSTTKA